ncbi:LysM peptidoglycan-binding domain-containing protein [Pelomonas sp. KK5]|uniref:LysM peptidoglycan-binding domain-containing protein n=1 Tax=Pelomonas sp. KK5 TaxID=1855730 RepID=UPI001E3EB72C|nr:LysM domain-containing protein [Pelomonas sp. KK5]
MLTGPIAQAATYPITPEQRATAQQVAQAGVPLSELAPDAPDNYTVKPHDTLWDISKLFLKSPWRWPELWGMNREEIRNPHLIYPGQLLVLIKVDGRARLQLGRGSDSAGPTVKLSPRVRSSDTATGAITAIPTNLIEPFLTDAVVFDTDELAKAPRVVATPEGRVLAARGDIAYALGEQLAQASDYRLFRNTTPLRDPTTKEVLGFEAPYIGTAEMIRPSGTLDRDGKTEAVPATLRIKTVKQEVGIGDRLSPVPQRGFAAYVPHAPAEAITGQVISLYGDAVYGGQNQIVSLNKGSQDGLERGHVLALWSDGRRVTDTTGERRQEIKLPDERNGVLFVFQTYKRVSYALIISVTDAVAPGDRFSQP